MLKIVDHEKRTSDGKELVAKEVNMAGMLPEERDRVKQEAEFLKQLKHPNIVAFEGTELKI